MMSCLTAFIPSGVSRGWLAKAYQQTRQVMGTRQGLSAQFSLAAIKLKEIAVDSEDEFLAIGDRLMDFHRQAATINTAVNAMVEQLQGGKGATARDDLASILDIMERIAVSSQQEGRTPHSLRLLVERLDQVTAPFAGFSRMNRHLKLLGTYTKIECAHMGPGAGEFGSLADRVARLSTEVSLKAEAISVRRDAVTATIQNALATATAITDASRESIGGIVEKTRRNLHALTAMAQHCAASAGVIAASSVKVADSLGEVVVSLQTHDMVRQQVQHVAEALDELADRWAKPSRWPAGLGRERGLWLKTGKICEIQTAQLNHSAAVVVGAVEQIIAALQEVMVQETRLSAETAELLGTTGMMAGTSIFTEMGSDLNGVVDTLIATATANRQMADSLAPVATIVDEIVCFATDIDIIAYDIKLIALNAQIQTAGLGDEGKGLGVLAGAIQLLSVEARNQAGEVSSMLAEIKEMSTSMHETARSEAALMQTKFEEMRRIMEEVLDALRTMNDELIAGLTSVNDMVQALAADVETVTGSLTVHHRLAGILAQVVDELDGITQEAMALVSPEEWGATGPSSQDDRYTMHSERDIHAAIVQEQGDTEPVEEAMMEVTALPALETESEPPGEDQALGDNIELF